MDITQETWYKEDPDRWDNLLSRGFFFNNFPTAKGYVGITMYNPDDNNCGIIIVSPRKLGQEQIKEIFLQTCEEYAQQYEIHGLEGTIN
jgi:hypothetical protein